jgi:ABC-type arginine transport system permease subunit
MEWNYTTWGLSSLAVYGVLTGIGIGISAMSSQLQCSKMSGTTSAMYGAIWAAPPAILYMLATFFQAIRSPFVNTLQSSPFGLTDETAQFVGVGYLMALTTWIMTSWAINRTERAVCNPDAKEMTEFKKKLIAELQQKQQEEEKNETAK